jgi:hypothetical protein
MRKVIFICFNLLVMSMPLKSWSAEAGGYFGLGLGNTKVAHHKETVFLENPTLSKKASFDESNVSLKVFAGYWFDAHIGMEVSFQDLTQFKVSDQNSSQKLYGISSGSISMILRQDALGQEWFAKAGLIDWDVCNQSSCSSSIEHGQDFTYGAGVNLNLYDSADRVMRIEWEHSNLDSLYFKTLDIISLNIVFNFGGSPE